MRVVCILASMQFMYLTMNCGIHFFDGLQSFPDSIVLECDSTAAPPGLGFISINVSNDNISRMAQKETRRPMAGATPLCVIFRERPLVSRIPNACEIHPQHIERHKLRAGQNVLEDFTATPGLNVDTVAKRGSDEMVPEIAATVPIQFRLAPSSILRKQSEDIPILGSKLKIDETRLLRFRNHGPLMDYPSERTV